MKKKRLMIIVVILAIVVTTIVVISQSPKWSERSFEAVVGETVTLPDGEIRLIVERTTEIYGTPLNSLHISKETKLVDVDGKETSIKDFKQGVAVKVTLKDSFIEESPFYYPTVYEIKLMNTDK